MATVPDPAMKISIDISDAVAKTAKAAAARQGEQLNDLAERGLRMLLRERGRSVFQLRDASFGGLGLQPEFRRLLHQRSLAPFRLRDERFDGLGLAPAFRGPDARAMLEAAHGGRSD